MTTSRPDGVLIPMPGLGTSDVVVPAAKTRRPRQRISAVKRDRLVDDWVTSENDVALVLAPPGFGKTTLVSQWADAASTPVAWVTVEPTDSDPVVLISTLIAGLARADLRMTLPGEALTADEPAFSRRVLPLFRRSLEKLDGPVLLVVDDIHAVDSDASLTVLAATVDSLPPGSRVVLAGRGRPDLPVARWRGEGRLLEVGVDELRFGTAETRGCLTSLLGRRPLPEEVSLVEATADGWPVAVYLEGAALERRGSLSGSLSHGLEDYLRSEVLALLDDDLADFLRRTSVLSSLSGPICDRVLGRRDSAEELRRIESATLLIARLEGPGGWYRVHPLLREALAADLTEESPDEACELHARAARWYHEHGSSEEAMWHATACGDPGLVEEVGWSYGIEMLMLGRASTMEGWLAQLALQDVESTPGLAILAAWTGIVRGDSAAVTRWAVAADRALGPDWISHLDRSPREPVLIQLVCLSGLLAHDEAAARSGAAVEVIPVSDPFRALALVVHGWSLTLAGDLEAGENTLSDALDLSRSLGIGTTAVSAAALRGYLQVARGDLAGARSSAQLAHRLWTDLDQQDSAPPTGLLFALDSHLGVDRRPAEQTRAGIGRCTSLTDGLTRIMPTVAVLVRAYLARTWAALGEHAQAATELEGATELAGQLAPSAWLSEQVAAASAEVQRLRPTAELSEAQRRVLVELGTDKTMGEIAADLHLSINTVKSHARDIYRKLGISTRREARRIQAGD